MRRAASVVIRTEGSRRLALRTEGPPIRLNLVLGTPTPPSDANSRPPSSDFPGCSSETTPRGPTLPPRPNRPLAITVPAPAGTAPETAGESRFLCRRHPARSAAPSYSPKTRTLHRTARIIRKCLPRGTCSARRSRWRAQCTVSEHQPSRDEVAAFTKLGSSRRRPRPDARLPLRPSRARKQQPTRRGRIGDNALMRCST